MDNLQVFKNNDFGSIRTVMRDNEAWFVGKDVAGILGYERATKAVGDHVDEEDKDEVPNWDFIGRMQNTPVINESGLYSLILSSKLPTAKKFKRWVTSEVLPAIRKNGSYSMPDFSNPAIAARAWADEYEKRNKAEKEIAMLKPKADFFDAVADSKDAVSIQEVAKTLAIKGLGRNNLYALLREKKILDDKNQPYQRYVDANYFRVIEQRYMADGEARISFKTLVYQKGLDFIRRLISKNDIDVFVAE